MALHSRQWQTVLVSVVVHVAAVFVIVVVPLLALDGFPELRSAVEYVSVEMKMPEMPRAPQPATVAPVAVQSASVIPLSAPDTIGPEVPRQPPSINMQTAPGGITDPLAGTPSADTRVAPPMPPRPDAPVRAGGSVKPPDRIAYTRPDYPPLAISARVSGSVIIEAVIGTDGVVRDARVLRSIPLLDDAALRAVRQWRYTPTLLNGVPVAVIMTVTVTFTLDRLNF
jgi:protein TonB